MKFVAAALLASVSAEHFLSEVITPEELAFMKYVSEYGKSYGTKAEFRFRLEQFKKSMTKIAAHDENTNGSTVGLNQFSDYTPHEYKKLLGYRPHKTDTKPTLLDDTSIPASVDWRTKGAVTPVKNQGQCGSCWAFSTTGSVEGAMFLKTNKLQSFSEQQLVDCSKNGNMGCNGGLMDYAFQYIEKNPLELESEYPYTAKNGKCTYVSSKGVGLVKGYKDVTSGSATQLKTAIAGQPVSVAIEADQFVFQGYTGGIITSGCGTKLDHGVLAVGYGGSGSGEYFLVKNSWGASWGDQGYVKIAPSQCGITLQPSYPTE